MADINLYETSTYKACAVCGARAIGEVFGRPICRECCRKETRKEEAAAVDPYERDFKGEDNLIFACEQLLQMHEHHRKAVR
jgi:arginyl-tRNA--protein-N-Asp/Glu arginylyltransferase